MSHLKTMLVFRTTQCRAKYNSVFVLAHVRAVSLIMNVQKVVNNSCIFAYASKILSILICIQFRCISWLIPNVQLVGAQRGQTAERNKGERGGKRLVFRGIHCKPCNNS